MFGKFVLWLCSVVLAFSLGAQSTAPSSSDSELEQKIRDHMDVIVDEAAGMVDDIADEIREDERVQQASEFVDSVKEIVENTKEDIDEHFGSNADESADAEGADSEVAETTADDAELPGETEESPRSDG